MLRQNSDVSARLRRMDPGTLWPSVWAFTDHLTALGHTPLTVSNRLQGARHFIAWLAHIGIAPSGVDEAVVNQFLHHRCQCAGRRSSAMSATHVRDVFRFVRFLVESGVVHASAVPTTSAPLIPLDKQVAEFLDWLRHHRGIVEATIARHRYRLVRLLPALGPDPAAYDAGTIRRVILDQSKISSSGTFASIETTLRVYLKFLLYPDSVGTGKRGLHGDS